ncbi:MAG: 3'-5' exonuclease [Bacteroidales bacterium]|nr:3'-5' exonuclease [Bacteroidales bacterium]
MKKIAIVDIETTGFLNQGGLLIEIGIVSLDLDNGKIIPEFDSVVKEKEFGPAHTRRPFGWIFQNSDLEFNDVNNAPTLESQKEEIQNVLNKFSLGATAFNKSFDFGFLRLRGFKIKELPCIMLTATPIVNLPPNPGFNTPKWPTVEQAWKYFFGNSGYCEKHRALDDAVHEAKIAYELYKQGVFIVN